MAHVRLGPQGRIVIPVELRRLLGFQTGDDLVAWAEEGRLVLERRDAVVEQLHGMFAAPDGVVERLLEERRGEAAREDEDAAGPSAG